eukprot:2263769-Pyramimonas_sp.AAC.1
MQGRTLRPSSADSGVEENTTDGRGETVLALRKKFRRHGLVQQRPSLRTENRSIGGQGCSGESTPLNNGSCKAGSSDGPSRERITMDGPKKEAQKGAPDEHGTYVALRADGGEDWRRARRRGELDVARTQVAISGVL